MATPQSVLEAIPDALLVRSGKPSTDATNAKHLQDWLAARGCRPSFLEIEQERTRRRTAVAA